MGISRTCVAAAAFPAEHLSFDMVVRAAEAAVNAALTEISQRRVDIDGEVRMDLHLDVAHPSTGELVCGVRVKVPTTPVEVDTRDDINQLFKEL